MGIDYNVLEVTISLDRIRDNFDLLKTKSSNPIPVIKSDAYGHGLGQVAQVYAQAGAESLAVGTVGEAANLRATGYAGEILSLLGPLDAADGRLAMEAGVTCMVHHLDQFHALVEPARKGHPITLALKFDTGMARLGFAQRQADLVTEILLANPNLKLTYVCSHLATADEPESRAFVLEQGQRFEEICGALKANGLSFQASLVNSAALLAYPELHFDLQRPGIALYGANPFQGTDLEALGQGLTPAMEVRTRVLSVHALRSGQAISYGRTYTAEKDMVVAIVAAGYADNYSRGLSNTGAMLIKGKRAPIVGRVCMQMTAVDVSHIPGVKPNDPVYLLGGEGPEAITPEELAKWWGTITYEVFCLLGQNRRVYR